MDFDYDTFFAKHFGGLKPCQDFNHSANSWLAIEERAQGILQGEPDPYGNSPHLVDSFIERAAQRRASRRLGL